MPKSVVQRAYRLYRRQKFPQTIRLLESQVFRFRNNGEFYTLLGLACLRSGDFGGAESYLRRAQQLRPEDLRPPLGLAAVLAHRGQTEEALKLWLRVLEEQPRNRQARRALELLRRGGAEQEAESFRSASVLKGLLPPVPAGPGAVVIPVVALLGAGLIAAAVLVGLPHAESWLRQKRQRPGVEAVQLPRSQPELTSPGGGAPVVLTERQVSRTFELIKKHLLAYRDNLAMREINRLLLSNASAAVKEKARLLASFVQQPDFSTLRDNFSYAEVAADPLLYRDCYVIWSGKAANVRIGSERIRFDLLVGYAAEEELLGVVPASLDFAADLQSGDAVEVLGRVEAAEGGLSLAVVSIHRLYGQ